MRSTWIRVARVVLVFGLSGWVTGVLLLATNDDTSLLDAVLSGTALRSGFAGLLVALAFSPPLVWLRPHPGFGLLVGPLASTTGIYTFFWLWPHSWQPTRWEAWKSTGIVLDAYVEYLLPGALLAGMLVLSWLRRGVAPTPFEQETRELEAEEAHTGDEPG